MEKQLTYKEIVKLISKSETVSDIEEVMWHIDRSFEHEKINWQDHETLYSIAGKLYEIWEAK